MNLDCKLVLTFRLWSNVTIAMNEKNMDLATLEKTKIEDNQRTLGKFWVDSNLVWESRFFNLVNGFYHFKFLYR